MKAGLRSLVVCMACCVGSLASPVATLAEEPSTGGTVGGSESLSGNPLVVPGAEPLLEGQTAAAQEAKLANPEEALARESSRTAYTGLTEAQIGELLRRSFPNVIDQPAGGVGQIPEGARILSYPGTNAAEVDLGGGQLGIVETSQPIARQDAPGHFTPIDLSLTPSGGGYAPAGSDVAVQIPANLSAGVQLPEDGISLTPVDSYGTPLSGTQGAIEGSSVLSANTQLSSDTLVRPTVTGFQMDSVLRSIESPQELFFKVGVPSGASLNQDPASGVVSVISAGETLATILPPAAQDAAGTSVPTSMTAVGDTLVVRVAHQSGSYLYPIEVDPEINDSQLAETSGGKRSNWQFKTSSEAKFGHKGINEGAGKESLETSGISEYGATEWAYWGYETKGNSKIYEVKTKTNAKNNGAKIESFLELQYPEAGKGIKETKKLLSTEVEKDTEYTGKLENICGLNAGKEECLPAAGKEKNSIHFQQSATGLPGSNYKFSDTMTEGVVSLSEPAGTHSTAGYNKESAEVEGEVEIEGKKVKQKRVNVLYGSGAWLTKYQGALELIAKDPGIGVSATKLEYESSAGKWEQLIEHNYLEKENGCQGVQCFAEHKEYWTLDPKLPNGEDKIRYRAEEAMSGTKSLETEGVATVKVDTAPPHHIVLNGLPWGNELSERAYELTVEATDGEGTIVASSGVKSISLFVDGHERTELGKQTGCTVAKGECTASAKWSINGAELGAGHHAIVIEAVDNAGNEARRYETISVRHSTPVAMGPGSVDLQSGDFTLGATDVSMGSGLTVGRNFSSRATEAGIEGPLGPQWSLDLGTTESLVEMVDGSILLTDGKGAQMIFAKVEGGGFEAPPGDSNLKLTLEENKETKQKLAYYLENTADHTKTKFTLPNGGTKAWVPTRQEGTVATDSVSYSYQTVGQQIEYALPAGSDPYAIVAGPGGDTWFTNYLHATIGKVTPAGVITEYSTGESQPTNLTTGPDGNIWFTDDWKNKIVKMTPFGAMTAYIRPEGCKPVGITLGKDGNLWFTETKANVVGKITTSGTVTEYALPKNSYPLSITTGPDGNLWFTETEANKIGMITTSGSITEYELPTNSEPRMITEGPDKNLWFTEGGYWKESTTNKIGKITTSGVVTEYQLPSGSKPLGITTGPDGNLWFTDVGTSRIGKVTTTGAITGYALPAGKEPFTITTGSDGKLWFANYGPYGEGTIGTMTTSGTVTEPTEVLAPAPVPAKVSCTPMKEGCRALKFRYATATTAKGESKSEWGEYRGRLVKVLLDTYNPTTKKMEEPAVAEYSYDKLGRLRTEWDPRVSPALKATYGYDAEGHVTGLTAPGQESWAFTYGAIAGDAGTGRLLKAAQAPASAGLWGGELPAKTEAPAITGSPVVGIRMAVSNGAWSGSPVAYAYQWEDCNSSGTECVPIVGATNPNYAPVSGDVGHTLVAQVTATNGGGSVAAASAASVAVSAASFTQSIDSGNSVNAVSCVPSTTDCVASDSKGNAFYATNVSASGSATWKSWSGPGTSPSEAVDCPSSTVCLMADGSKSGFGGTMYYATSLGGTWTEAYNPSYGVDAISCPSSSFCVDGQDNLGYFRYSTNPPSTSWTLESQGSAPMKGVFCLSTSFCAIADGSGSVHVATSTTQIESSSWTSTDVNGTSALNGVACTSTTSCLVVDGAGNVLNLAIASKGEATATKHNIDGTNSLTAIICTGTTTCTTVDNKGNVFVSTNGGETWTKKYVLSDNLTSVSCASSSLCATVDTTGNVTAFNPTGSSGTEGELRTPQPGATIDYNVPVQSTGAPYKMGENETTHKPETEKWGQTEDVPVEATAIFPPDSPQGWPASGYTRATVYYLDEQGRNVNVATPSSVTEGAISTTEYNEENNDVIRTLSADNRLKALEAGAKSVEVSKLLDTEYTYNSPECRKETPSKEKEMAEPGTRLCETWGPQHEIKYTPNGFKETREALGRDHTKYFYEDLAHGAPEVVTGEEKQLQKAYDLVTETSDLALLANEEEVEVRKATTSYSGQEGLGWKLRAPTSTTAATEPEGAKVTHTTLYNKETGQITETRGPEGSSGNSAHDAKIIYYTPENEAEVAACRKHPEWAGLVCETLPAKQPETSGVPNLPVTETTYNLWNEPETITETFTFVPHETAVRTKKEAYDPAGRLTTSETKATGTTDIALPPVSDKYNTETGILETQSATIEGKTKTITSKRDKLGRLTEYVDADENTAIYKYGGAAIDNQLEEMSDSSNAAKSKQTYTYDETTKALKTLVDSAAGTFTATYDAEGKMTSETYPNGMCANNTYNAMGEATQIEYIKTTNCAESKPTVWFSEARSPSVRGETMSRSSTLANETYSYDTIGRLTETQETPAGEGCSVRLYVYDEESNRSTLTKRAPGSKGECLTEGGAVEKHTYDEANRLTDTGVEYDGFANITKLPAADAEGHELVSTYYIDGAVATQSQNGVTNEYGLDPIGRVRKTLTGGKEIVTHYDGSGAAVAWTSESTEKWTRDIPGIDGTLSAVQTNSETKLQLHDLQGNIVATASLSSEATKLLSTYNSTEFGVPNKEKAPPPYAWLGAGDVASSLSSGVITYGATSYVPQTGRALQSGQVEPPGAPGGTGVGTPYVSQEEPWNMQGAAREGEEAPGLEAGREKTAEEEAIRKADFGPEIDPTELLTWQKTLALAKGWMQSAKEMENAIEPYEEGSGRSGTVDIINSDAELMEKASHELEECATAVKKYKPMGMCWVSYTHKEVNIIGLGLFDLVTSFARDSCRWYKGHVAKHEWFYCPTLRHPYWEG